MGCLATESAGACRRSQAGYHKKLCKHLCVAREHPSCSDLPCAKALESLFHEMGGKPWCGAAADTLIARATSYGHLWSLTFSGQWLVQAPDPAKACAISLKLLFVTKSSSGIMIVWTWTRAEQLKDMLESPYQTSGREKTQSERYPWC